ncbi:hypothetical protein HY417_00410 [Candidatus Kaiserbacteria bacterium]|nr:hypothetical protein [Candidatus Kaiserbacteria bacterium]
MIAEPLFGVGKEKETYDQGKRIEAIFHEELTNEQIKSVYDLNRIAHALFPMHIPRIKSAGNTGGGISGFWDTKVPRDPMHEEIQNLQIKKYQQAATMEDLRRLDQLIFQADHKIRFRPAVQEFIAKMRDAGLQHHDTETGYNYAFGNGEQTFWFVDKKPGWLRRASEDGKPAFLMHYDAEKLQRAIMNIEDPEVRQEAQRCFDRLQELAAKAGITKDNILNL